MLAIAGRRHVATAAGTGRADAPALDWRQRPGRRSPRPSANNCTAPTSTAASRTAPPSPEYPTSTCCSCCITSSRPPTGPTPMRSRSHSTSPSPQIDGTGILLSSVSTVRSELERHDLGFFVACLCTPLLGDDLAAHLPAIGLIPCSPARPTATSAWPCHAGENERPKPSPAPSASPSVGDRPPDRAHRLHAGHAALAWRDQRPRHIRAGLRPLLSRQNGANDIDARRRRNGPPPTAHPAMLSVQAGDLVPGGGPARRAAAVPGGVGRGGRGVGLAPGRGGTRRAMANAATAGRGGPGVAGLA